MNKPRKAKFVKVERGPWPVPDMTKEEKAAGGRLMWVAVDSAGRRFVAETEAAAVKMLEQYNH